jgi:hypothetical protein
MPGAEAAWSGHDNAVMNTHDYRLAMSRYKSRYKSR